MLRCWGCVGGAKCSWNGGGTASSACFATAAWIVREGLGEDHLQRAPPLPPPPPPARHLLRVQLLVELRIEYSLCLLMLKTELLHAR